MKGTQSLALCCVDAPEGHVVDQMFQDSSEGAGILVLDL